MLQGCVTVDLFICSKQLLKPFEFIRSANLMIVSSEILGPELISGYILFSALNFFVYKPISICCSFIFITPDMCHCNLVQELLLISFEFYDNIESTEVCILNICLSALNLI